MTGQGPFRCLEIPAGETKDHDGREIGDDHLVMLVDTLGEPFMALALTTDRVRTSEYGDVVPATQAGLTRLIADCLNRTARSLGYREWARLCAEHDEPTHPPHDHPHHYETCAGCGQPIVGGSAASLVDGVWLTQCSPCWLKSMSESMAEKPRPRRSRRPRP